MWEITGAEFTKSDSHTADGLSIRFPRMTKIRKDKSWKEATDLDRLKVTLVDDPFQCFLWLVGIKILPKGCKGIK